MNDTTYTPEFFTQIGKIYDKLSQLPDDKRSAATMMMEAFIIGMQTQERLAAEMEVVAR
ncbi:MAG: hypothetical protein HDT14_09205 [Oscillibacter sp.]|nr:hypothetical protein [Oscillibacter sp.]